MLICDTSGDTPRLDLTCEHCKQGGGVLLFWWERRGRCEPREMHALHPACVPDALARDGWNLPDSTPVTCIGYALVTPDLKPAVVTFEVPTTRTRPATVTSRAVGRPAVVS